MPRFDSYILSLLLRLFGLFALILVSVYWVNRAVQLFDELIADGQSAGVFLEFTALTLPNVVRLVLPVAAFAAAVFVTNRLSTESELVVMQATGYSAFRMARPVLFFGLIVAGLGAVLVHALLPASRTELAERRSEITQTIGARFLSAGEFLHPSDGLTLFIRDITGEGELRDVFLSDARSSGRRTTYTAARAHLVHAEEGGGPKLVMFDGTAQTLRLSDRRLSTTRFADFTYDLSGLMQPDGPRRRDPDELATTTLLAAGPAAQAATGTGRAMLRYEGHARIAEPFLAVAAALVGFAALMLGGFSRFGLWRQVVLAIATLIFIKLADNFFAELAQDDPRLWPVVYLPPVLGTALAGAMLWVAARPRFFRLRRRRGGAT